MDADPCDRAWLSFHLQISHTGPTNFAFCMVFWPFCTNKFYRVDWHPSLGKAGSIKCKALFIVCCIQDLLSSNHHLKNWDSDILPLLMVQANTIAPKIHHIHKLKALSPLTADTFGKKIFMFHSCKLFLTFLSSVFFVEYVDCPCLKTIARINEKNTKFVQHN